MLGTPITLVVVTRDRVIRAEFRSRGGAQPSAIVVADRPESDDPVSPVVVALSGLRRRAGRVFVLSSDVWTRTLRVPPLNLKSLSTAELAQSIAFEAEPLSGLSSAEATTGVLPLDDSQGPGTVWVGQLPTATVAEIEEVVRGAGGTLAGILHPAAMPLPLGDRSSSVRVEFWSDASSRVIHSDRKLQTLQVEQGAATANREAILGEWARQSNVDISAVDVLVPDFRPSLDGEQTFADETTLETWLTGWHRVLSARRPATPLLRPAPRPLTSPQRRNYAAALTLIALTACVGHAYWVRNELARVAAEKAVVEAPARELATIMQQRTEADTAIKKLREELTKRSGEVDQAETILAAHRTRLGELLERLARESSRQWVLREINGSPRQLKLIGVTMHPEHISGLAAELAKDLADLGWTVDPPQHMARNVRDDGGPWSFELQLRDERLAPPSGAPAATPTRVVPELVRVPME
jgi:hypothetical protein